MILICPKAFRVFWFLLFCLAFASQASAQEAIAIGKMVARDNQISIQDISSINNAITVSDTLHGWNYNWIGNLNGSQASYQNWSQGGVNSISGTASTMFNARYRNKRYAYALSTDFKYGKAYIGKEGTRKTDDDIAVNNKFSYNLTNSNFNLFTNINLSTQFDKGFDYSGKNPVLISQFFSPAYFIQIAGAGYDPSDSFNMEAGLAVKETFVLNDSLTTRYGLKPGDNYRIEPGYSLALNFEKDVAKNVHLTSSAQTFTNLKRAIRHTDFTFSTQLTGKVNNYLNMNFQFAMVYNDHFNKRIQIKQVLSAGLSFRLL